jgi:uncharacterized membrane protein YfhO
MRQTADFAEKAWIHRTDILPQDVGNGPAVLRVRRNWSRYRIDVDASAGTHVVIADVAWPGWRAYVDGRRVKLESANLAFLGVYVPPGRHRLRLDYLPDAFVRGRAVSFGTIVLLSFIAIWRRRK